MINKTVKIILFHSEIAIKGSITFSQDKFDPYTFHLAFDYNDPNKDIQEEILKYDSDSILESLKRLFKDSNKNYGSIYYGYTALYLDIAFSSFYSNGPNNADEVTFLKRLDEIFKVQNEIALITNKLLKQKYN